MVSTGDNSAIKPSQAAPDVYFGVAFQLNNREIALEPLTAINKIRENGLECRLNEPVEFGEIGENLRSLLVDLGVSENSLSSIFVDDGVDENNQPTYKINPDLEDLPVIGKVVTILLDADVTLEQFYLRIPPAAARNAPIRYTVGMSAMWDVASGEGKLFGNLYLKGLYLKVSNEDLIIDPPPLGSGGENTPAEEGAPTA